MACFFLAIFLLVKHHLVQNKARSDKKLNFHNNLSHFAWIMMLILADDLDYYKEITF